MICQSTRRVFAGVGRARWQGASSWIVRAGCRSLAASASGADSPTTDATFRYTSFEWQTSCGQDFPYEYVVAQRPAGGDTARNALDAVDERLPRPTTGWSVLLIPSVSLVCNGKEEMRPLAGQLSQMGHRCYILEWPGWAVDSQANYVLARCKPEAISAEYEDFWCQLFEHIAREELAETRGASAGTAPRLCVVGAGNAGIYGMRAASALRFWAEQGQEVQKEARAVADCYAALALLAPSWRTARSGLLSYLSPAAACRWLGALLHSESRAGRWLQSFYFSSRTLRRHFPHSGSDVGDSEGARLMEVASWLFRRPRPFVATDGAASNGFLDPPGLSGAACVAKEVVAAAAMLPRGALVLLPEALGNARASGESGAELARVLAETEGRVLRGTLPTSSPVPHEVAITATAGALQAWLAKG